ncbi:MAG TPA: hypothetical protein VGA78_02690 [Gemmatimonadales bacterium]|jgi:hypothetical protein
MRIPILVAGALVVFIVTPLVAQRPRQRPEMTVAGIQRRNFSRDRQEIERYFVAYRNDLPPGLAKRERLPPGVQKQLVKNGELPPGLEPEIQPLPRALEVKLSALDVAFRRGFVDGKVLTWDRKTRRVVDIIVVY